jgi:hypothetical protein
LFASSTSTAAKCFGLPPPSFTAFAIAFFNFSRLGPVKAADDTIV